MIFKYLHHNSIAVIISWGTNHFIFYLANELHQPKRHRRRNEKHVAFIRGRLDVFVVRFTGIGQRRSVWRLLKAQMLRFTETTGRASADLS